jgi:hypothetical protein
LRFDADHKPSTSITCSPKTCSFTSGLYNITSKHILDSSLRHDTFHKSSSSSKLLQILYPMLWWTNACPWHGFNTIMWLHSSQCDRGEVPDLSVSGDNFDLVGGDPHDPTTSSETRSTNAIAEPTPDGYRPCWRKISVITKINSRAQSKNEQESETSNLNITRRWSSESHRTTRICACSGVAKARCKTKLEL